MSEQTLDEFFGRIPALQRLSAQVAQLSNDAGQSEPVSNLVLARSAIARHHPDHLVWTLIRNNPRAGARWRCGCGATGRDPLPTRAVDSTSTTHLIVEILAALETAGRLVRP